MTPQDQQRFFANENGDPLHLAFDKKSAVHPGARGRPLDPESIGEVMSNGWMELTLAGEFWQVNLCQALIDYFAVVIELQPASPGMMDLGG